MRSLKAIVFSLCLFLCTILRAAEGIINVGSGLKPDGGRVVTLPREEVISLLMSRKVFWDNGIRVTVYLLPKDNLATREFLVSLGIPPSAYFDSINSMYSAGRTNVPTILPTDISMLLNTANTVGAIGYINNGDLANLMPSLYILKIRESKK